MLRVVSFIFFKLLPIIVCPKIFIKRWHHVIVTLTYCVLTVHVDLEMLIWYEPKIFQQGRDVCIHCARTQIIKLCCFVCFKLVMTNNKVWHLSSHRYFPYCPCECPNIHSSMTHATCTYEPWMPVRSQTQSPHGINDPGTAARTVHCCNTVKLCVVASGCVCPLTRQWVPAATCLCISWVFVDWEMKDSVRLKRWTDCIRACVGLQDLSPSSSSSPL